MVNLFDLDGALKMITFRAALAGILSFVLCLVIGPRVIAWLRRNRVGEVTEKNDSRRLDAIMSGKKHTPTMGGVFMVLAILASTALFGDLTNPALWVLMASVAALGGLGAFDDYLKLSGRRRGGLSVFWKLLAQCLIGLGAGTGLCLALLAVEPEHATRFYVVLDGWIDLGALYPVFVMLIVVAFANAVNITDGLDGLAGGCLSISVFAYAVIAYVVGRVDFSAYLGIPYMTASAEMTVFCTAMLGATLGFLWFNAHPAQVFMGDSGSLPLGGALALIACVTKQEMLLLLIGGVFVIEAFSSFAQILSFKLTGRRIFRIAPLHHHFQFKGMSETKITMRFWIVAAVMAVASLAMLKLRH
ncbi:MAG: phospho-N-acetylmuramoyl-pentapeptide-transferase [Planctomycetota bacterium]|jgi:phospho-N-acetylmuramoyl-pentapeptide-transferase